LHSVFRFYADSNEWQGFLCNRYKMNRSRTPTNITKNIDRLSQHDLG